MQKRSRNSDLIFGFKFSSKPFGLRIFWSRMLNQNYASSAAKKGKTELSQLCFRLKSVLGCLNDKKVLFSITGYWFYYKLHQIVH